MLLDDPHTKCTPSKVPLRWTTQIEPLPSQQSCPSLVIRATALSVILPCVHPLTGMRATALSAIMPCVSPHWYQSHCPLSNPAMCTLKATALSTCTLRAILMLCHAVSLAWLTSQQCVSQVTYTCVTHNTVKGRLAKAREHLEISRVGQVGVFTDILSPSDTQSLLV